MRPRQSPLPHGFPLWQKLQLFLKEHGHPDRVFLENLRWNGTAGEWVWDKVWWEYANGQRVRYPEFNELPANSSSR